MISKIKIIGLPNQEIMQSNVKMPVEGRQREAYQQEIVTAVVELTKQPSFTFAAWGTHGLLHDSDSCQGMSSGAAMASGSGNLLKMQILSPPPHTNCEVLGMRPSNQIYRACQVILMQLLTALPQQNGQDRANLLLLRVQKSGFHHFSKKKRSSFIILAVSFTQKLIKLWFKNSKPPWPKGRQGWGMVNSRPPSPPSPSPWSFFIGQHHPAPSGSALAGKGERVSMLATVLGPHTGIQQARGLSPQHPGLPQP